MTLALYQVDAGELDELAPGDDYLLGGPEGHHAATVRRTSVGERVMVGDGAGRRITAAVIAAGPGELTLRVEDASIEPEPSPRFVLVQALAKDGRDEDAIEAATEIGVDGVIPWQAQRSIVQWKGAKAERALTKWRHVITRATKQSRRARTPELTPLVSSVALIERVKGARLAVVLHESASEPLAALDLPDDGEVLLVVGPEGGIADEELAAFAEAGAHLVRLGSTVLRSSSAGPAALAVLSAQARWR
ncbi:16S rRNA (uracil(1498)-N(3))-methyltransferase [Janibacter sp. GXQ6167]|uniref:16S rRNA (uracil(1498)-N(3))-methyltransferase n=1 Tax=Janibacter sp. GXQ6167 TaxID=3240791 RepID=UPI00352699F9